MRGEVMEEVVKIEQRFSGYSSHPDLHSKINKTNKTIGNSRLSWDLWSNRNALGYEVFHNIFKISPRHSVDFQGNYTLSYTRADFQGNYTFSYAGIHNNLRLLTNTVDNATLVGDEGTALTKLNIKHFEPIMS